MGALVARLGGLDIGGLGTVHNGLASDSILYGPDVDVLMWDSSMTEKVKASQDLFHRQYILGGKIDPILWSLALAPMEHL